MTQAKLRVGTKVFNRSVVSNNTNSFHCSHRAHRTVYQASLLHDSWALVIELEVFAKSQDSNMELQHSSSLNSKEVDLVKGKHVNIGIY